MTKQTCITVDLEDEFLDNGFELTRQVKTILSLFQTFHIRATFFICADLVENNRKLIDDIARNHEVASHGFTHRILRRLNPKELEWEISASRETFTKLGMECHGFRCPFLIIPPDLGEILSGNGYSYDSSVILSPFTVQSLLYPFSRKRVTGIAEIPIQTATILRLPLNLSLLRQIGSKFFFRILPPDLNIFYFHPWELCEKEHLGGPGIRKRLLTNTGKRALNLLEKLFSHLEASGTRFVCCGDWLRNQNSQMITGEPGGPRVDET